MVSGIFFILYMLKQKIAILIRKNFFCALMFKMTVFDTLIFDL